MKPKKTLIFTSLGDNRRIKNDIILLLALLLFVLLVGLCYFFLRADGDTVVVTVKGDLFAEYSLNEDNTIELRDGEHFNILVIRDGKAYIERADCLDGICIAHKPIFRDGENIVCLPNKVVVTVHAVEKAEQPDILA